MERFGWGTIDIVLGWESTTIPCGGRCSEWGMKRVQDGQG